MLSVGDLVVRYGRAVRALRGVSLDVPDGSIVAVLGSNGAGKSTLLRAISGTLPLHRGVVERGSIVYDGVTMSRARPSRIVDRGIVQVPEGRRIFAHLTVAENLRAGAIGNPDRRARDDAQRRVLELFPLLGTRLRDRAGLLSGGQQQMLAIGRALMAAPRLLLLDEPSLGLAPLVVAQVRDAIREINKAGTSVLLIEQNAAMALSIADSAYVLDLGTVSLHGDATRLSSTDEVRRLYLGEREGDDEEVTARVVRRPLERWTA